MTSYLLEPIDLIFVKGYGFFVFAKNMRKNIVKNITNHLSSKCNQKRLNHTKQSATDAIKTTSKWATQKTAEATDDLIDNKIANNITKVSRTSRWSNSKVVTNKVENIGLETEIRKESYIYPEKRRKNYWWSKINIEV